MSEQLATEVVLTQKHEHRKRKYRIDLWLELKQRWMVGGVLAALLAAVLAPRLGAPGGNYRMLTRPLGTQYLWFVPLSYIYFSAGVRAGRGGVVWGAGGVGGAGDARLVCVSCAHACVVAPALAVVLLAGTTPGSLHHALLQGVLVTSVGGGCAWLSLAVCEEPAAPLVVAAVHLASSVAAPLAMLVLCGRATVPTLSSVAGAICGAVPAFAAGAACGAGGVTAGGVAGGGGARGAALALLYVQCCEGLAPRGVLRLPDLGAVLLLELSWLGMSLGACWAYARCGLLSAAQARVLAACALPRAAAAGPAGGRCAAPALARLLAAFLPPAQALLLAALPPPATRAPALPH